MRNKLLIGIFAIILLEGIAYAVIWSGPTLTEFETTSITPVCDYENYVWRFWNDTTHEIGEKNSLTDCYRENGHPSTTCCPSGHRCNMTTKLCDEHETPVPLFCSDYTTRDECRGFDPGVANRSIDFRVTKMNYCGSVQSDVIHGETCWWWIKNCACLWNVSTGVCEAQYSETNLVCNTTTPITADGTCTFSDLQSIDECNTTGFVKYAWGAIWEGAPEKSGDCNPGSKNFKCGTKLVFFTIASLVITIVAIIIVYLLILKKKEGKDRKKIEKGRKKKK